MHLLSILIFAFTANIDSFLIGICYGAKNTHIRFANNLLIGAVVCLSTIFSMSLGNNLSEHMLFSYSQVLGGTILILLGIHDLLSFFKGKKEIPTQSSGGRSLKGMKISDGYLAIKDTILIGLGLALNNIALGIGASITGIAVVPTSVVTLVFSVIFLYSGNRIGASYVPDFIVKYAEPITSILIILLGIFEMFI